MRYRKQIIITRPYSTQFIPIYREGLGAVKINIIMATFNSTTFGKISGKYGEALATKSKTTGKNYLRPASVPTNPRTPKQVEHRGKFGYINRVMRSFYPVFKITFGGNVGIRFGINIAFKNAIVGEYPDFLLDYSQLQFTDGGLYQTGLVTAGKSADHSIKIDWDYSDMAGNNAEDTLNLIFYNEDTDQAVLKQAVATRDLATVTVELPLSGPVEKSIVGCTSPLRIVSRTQSVNTLT